MHQSSRTTDGIPLQPTNNIQQRTKWTKEMNTHIVRSYFTALKTAPTTYRKAMYDKWKERYGENFSEQRICDQKRTIFLKARNDQNQRLRGNWLTQIEVDNIRHEINTEQPLEIELEETPPDADVETQQQEEPTVAESETNNAIEPPHDEPQRIEDHHGQRVDARHIISTFEGHLMDAELSPFDKRKKFRKPGKTDLGKLTKSCNNINELIDVNKYQCNDITSINDLTYAFAVTAIKTAGLEKACITSDRKNPEKKIQKWIIRIENTIKQLRKDISQIEQMNTLNPSRKIKLNNRNIANRFDISNETTRKKTSEKLKQKLLAKNNRLKRYKERQNQYHQNRQFVNAPEKFYQELRGNNIEIDKTPTAEEVESFWKPILGTAASYNQQATWVNDYEETINIQPYNFENITIDEIKESTNKFSNWKSPGVDNLQNFWWNKFEKTHPKLRDIYNDIVDNPDIFPEWFVTGRTTLVPKKAQTETPSNYRPITCLPTTYKILSSIMTKRMNYHLQTYELIPEEQKGGVSDKQRTIDQLLTDNMILDHAKQNKRHLSTAWIDYRKAFDSVPHDWLQKSLEIHKFPAKITNFFSTLMTKWKTSMHICTQNETISTNNINIKNGIFQGDCPSGLHFILCLLPLSWLIKRSKIGYSIGRRNERSIVSHLLFMDDIKLYANNVNQLRNLLEIVSTFSNDIKMSFGLDKCKILNITKGILAPSEDVTLVSDETIQALDIREQYKYLGKNTVKDTLTV